MSLVPHGGPNSPSAFVTSGEDARKSDVPGICVTRPFQGRGHRDGRHEGDSPDRPAREKPPLGPIRHEDAGNVTFRVPLRAGIEARRRDVDFDHTLVWSNPGHVIATSEEDGTKSDLPGISVTPWDFGDGSVSLP